MELPIRTRVDRNRRNRNLWRWRLWHTVSAMHDSGEGYATEAEARAALRDRVALIARVYAQPGE